MVKVVAIHSIQRRDEKTGRIVEYAPKSVFEAPEHEVIELLRVSGPDNPAIRYANEVDAATAKQLAAQGVTLIEKPERLPRRRADGSIEIPDAITGRLPSEQKVIDDAARDAELNAQTEEEKPKRTRRSRAQVRADKEAAAAEETADELADDESGEAPDVSDDNFFGDGDGDA